MISESLAALRMARGVSQETVAEAAGVSRQAYARWEQGETLPDIERCAKLAQFFGTTVDAMIAYPNGTVQPPLLPGPPGKHIWGTVTVGERGQIVIPKAAREPVEAQVFLEAHRASPHPGPPPRRGRRQLAARSAGERRKRAPSGSTAQTSEGSPGARSAPTLSPARCAGASQGAPARVTVASPLTLRVSRLRKASASASGEAGRLGWAPRRPPAQRSAGAWPVEECPRAL